MWKGTQHTRKNYNDYLWWKEQSKLERIITIIMWKGTKQTRKNYNDYLLWKEQSKLDNYNDYCVERNKAKTR